ncbi:predicted protein [Sclerotinia sclerotiorum 1980 UF-70]|uniref:Uncharacterized protein n=1 Tax=Sclerotinia sclerotiorum (strain ATCC 18683 / 1980 / Ss-1) TaxID=665079 RepID=A7EEC8_SCLS1|nr:predicted protein [Sclerotinia sclerotiorum 1980 UF-70]EDO01194.1 predicted protein [Sclerotinia sclerotiorum 1980 UF-70]
MVSRDINSWVTGKGIRDLAQKGSRVFMRWE